MTTGSRYFAFISYSRKDSKAAHWLQRRLEWFRVPTATSVENRPLHPEYVRPVFRDKTNLEVDDDYLINIRQALEQSRFLVVLCSPNAAASEPVNSEITHFLNHHQGRLDTVVPVILYGSVLGERNCLRPALVALGEAITGRNLPKPLRS